MKLIESFMFAQQVTFDTAGMTDLEIIQRLTKYQPLDLTVFSGPVECYSKFFIKPSDIEYGKEEHDFRMMCLQEELDELKTAVSENDAHETFDALIDLLIFAIGTSYRYGSIAKLVLEYRSYNTMNAQYIVNDVKQGSSKVESLIIMIEYYINVISSNYQCGKYTETIARLVSLLLVYLTNEYDLVSVDEYYKRVTAANLSKELGPLSKRDSFAIDLTKPEGWVAPSSEGLL